VDEVTASLQRHSSLSLSQHGYLRHHGTDAASLQLLNTLETAWDARRPLYGCFCDISKAFDSVSKPLIVLCWQRLGLPAEFAQWLVNLDANGYTIFRTPRALAQWDVEGLEGLKELSFNPERGTGQGDILSPLTWLAVFDVLLTRCLTVNNPLRIISISTGRMAPLIQPVPSVMPTICSHLPRPFLACNAQRTLLRYSPWFLTSRLPHLNSGFPLWGPLATARRHGASPDTCSGMGIPRSPYSPPWNLQKPGRNLPNQPQRFHLPSAHETETHNHHPCSVH